MMDYIGIKMNYIDMLSLVFLFCLIVVVSCQNITVYNAIALTNNYGLPISSDGTMTQWRISSPGNLLFTPKTGAYLYTNFQCKDYTVYTGVELTMTASVGAQFTLELQQSNSQCTGRTSQASINTKDFVTFDGTKKTFFVPFSRFSGLDPKKVWALSMVNFSLNVDHILHSIGFVVITPTITTTTSSILPTPTNSQWSNYCAYKVGNEHYLAECVKTNLGKDDFVTSFSFCPSMSSFDGSLRNWVNSCTPYWSKDEGTGHSDFIKISVAEFDTLIKSGYAYSPGSGKAALTTTSYKATTATFTEFSIVSGTATLYPTHIGTTSTVLTLPITSYFNTTVMVPKTIIATKTFTKIVGTNTVTYVEATETITPWPTTVRTSTVTNTTSSTYSTFARVETSVVSYTNTLTSTSVYLDTYGPVYTPRP